jgi:hypothetical protein
MMRESLPPRLIGLEMSAVTFVRDYLQLHFDGPVLTILVDSELSIAGEQYASRAPGFRDALCSCISKRVAAAEVVPGERWHLCFEDGAVLNVSLRPEHRTGPEAVLLRDEASGEWDWW